MGSNICSSLSGRPEEATGAPVAQQAPTPKAEPKPQHSPPAALTAKDLARKRKSVSAEAYGAWNKIEDVVLPEHPKTDEQKVRLKAVLQNSFLFASLSGKEMETTLLAMKEEEFAAGTTIITEGEDG